MSRNTQQRAAIREVFLRAGRPLRPAEVVDLARAEVPSISLATVYRTLKSLAAEGWLHPVELPGEPPRYERRADHHHHFKCIDCDRVFDLEGCPGRLKDLLPRGFELLDHHLLLSGRCDACAAAN